MARTYQYTSPGVTIEKSPWQSLFDELPGTILNMFSLGKQLEFQAAQTVLAQDFQKVQGELAFARQIYAAEKSREATLEDQISALGGLSQETQTKPAAEIMKMASTDLFQEIKTTGSNIDKLLGIKSEIAEASIFAKDQSDLYGGLIKAGEDEAWKDYLLEGGLDIGPQGELVGTGEMKLWLEKQTPATIEKLKSENYRRSLLSSLRTIEEAKELVSVDQQISVNNASIAAAEMQLTQGNYDMFNKILDRNDIVFGDIYKQQGLAIASGINVGGLGLKDLQNMDTDDYSDLMEDITEKYPSVTQELSTFFNTIAVGGQLGVDVTESLTRAQSRAYEDFLQLNNMYEEIYENAVPGSSFNPALDEHKKVVEQQIGDFKRGDKSYLEIKRLENKVKGYQAIGIYNTGIPRMERSFSVIQAHNEQENLRLSADSEEWEKVSKKGYPVNLEVYEPKNMYEMPEQDWTNLQTSLAALKATTPDPANTGADLHAFLGQAKIRKEEITVQKGTHGNFEEARESLSEAMLGSGYWGRRGRSPVMSWDIGELETQVKDRVRVLSSQGKPDEVKAILDAWTSYQKYYTELTELYK